VPAGRFDAEALLAEIARSFPPAGRRFLFVRGARARDALPRGLRAAGAQVDEAVVYRTEPAPVDEDALRAALVRDAFDALTFTSASAARRFAACLDASARSAAGRALVAAIGDTTAAALRAAGLPPEAVAERADVRALVAALVDALARRRPGGPREGGA
jgi:uroporphyrinogen-III synthase